MTEEEKRIASSKGGRRKHPNKGVGSMTREQRQIVALKGVIGRYRVQLAAIRDPNRTQTKTKKSA